MSKSIHKHWKVTPDDSTEPQKDAVTTMPVHIQKDAKSTFVVTTQKEKSVPVLVKMGGVVVAGALVMLIFVQGLGFITANLSSQTVAIQVIITPQSFSPDAMSVYPGDVVEWVNVSGVEDQIISVEKNDAGEPLFSSPLVPSGQKERIEISIDLAGKGLTIISTANEERKATMTVADAPRERNTGITNGRISNVPFPSSGGQHSTQSTSSVSFSSQSSVSTSSSVSSQSISSLSSVSSIPVIAGGLSTTPSVGSWPGNIKVNTHTVGSVMARASSASSARRVVQPPPQKQLSPPPPQDNPARHITTQPSTGPALWVFLLGMCLIVIAFSLRRIGKRVRL